MSDEELMKAAKEIATKCNNSDTCYGCQFVNGATCRLNDLPCKWHIVYKEAQDADSN